MIQATRLIIKRSFLINVPAFRSFRRCRSSPRWGWRHSRSCPPSQAGPPDWSNRRKRIWSIRWSGARWESWAARWASWCARSPARCSPGRQQSQHTLDLSEVTADDTFLYKFFFFLTLNFPYSTFLDRTFFRWAHVSNRLRFRGAFLKR